MRDPARASLDALLRDLIGHVRGFVDGKQREIAVLQAEAARRRRWLEASAEIAALLISEVDRRVALQLVADLAREVSGADIGAVMLLRSQEELEVMIASGVPPELVPTDPLPLQGSLAGLVVTSGEPMVCEDVREDPRAVRNLLDLEKWPVLGPTMLVPLRTADGVAGVLTLAWTVENVAAFHEVDVELPQRFAEQAALALQVAQARSDHERVVLFEDRERIARDLHDLVIQRLFAIGLTLENTSRMVDHPVVAVRLSEAVDEIDETIKEIRRSIFALGVHGADDVRVVLDKVVDRSADTLGFRPMLHTNGPLNARLPGDVRADLVAVLGEALSNVARHGRASRVDVHLSAGDEVMLVVTDDGRGMPSQTPHVGGLANMRERAERHGGRFVLESVPGLGTTVRWQVPTGRRVGQH